MKPLTVAVGELTLDTVIMNPAGEAVSLGTAIVEAAAAALVDTADYLSIKERIRGIRDEEIRARVAVEIEQAMDGPLTLTNQFGEPMGRAGTLREEIARMTVEALKMDERYHREPTPAQKCIREHVSRAFERELAEAVAYEKEKVITAVRAKAAELIADAVRRGLGQ